MHIYLLVAVPLSFVYVLILRDMAGGPASILATPAAKGALASLAVALVSVFLRRFFERPFSGTGLFFYIGVLDYVMPLVLGFCLFLVLTNSPSSLSPDEGLSSLLAFFAGLFSAQGLFDLFQRDYFGAYELFVAPSMRVALTLLAASVYYHFADETFWTRYLYLVLLALIPFVTAVPHLLFATYLTAIGAGLTVLLLLAGFAAVLFWTGARTSLRLR